MPLAEIVFRGYDHDGNQYNEGEHTAEDKTQIESMKATLERLSAECQVANSNTNILRRSRSYRRPFRQLHRLAIRDGAKPDRT